MPIEHSITKLSNPILRRAKSVTIKLRISWLPYVELNIDETPGFVVFGNSSGKRIDTHAIRDPSVLYFSDNCNAVDFMSEKMSLPSLLGDLALYKNTLKMEIINN